MFCIEKNISQLQPSIGKVLDFLTGLFDAGLNYSTLNTARSALSCFVTVHGQTVGSHPLVKRFKKGVYQSRPVFPKYQYTWDVTTVLDYLRNLGQNCDLSVKEVTLKLNMLL